MNNETSSSSRSGHEVQRAQRLLQLTGRQAGPKLGSLLLGADSAPHTPLRGHGTSETPSRFPSRCCSLRHRIR